MVAAAPARSWRSPAVWRRAGSRPAWRWRRPRVLAAPAVLAGAGLRRHGRLLGRRRGGFGCRAGRRVCRPRAWRARRRSSGRGWRGRGWRGRGGAGGGGADGGGADGAGVDGGGVDGADADGAVAAVVRRGRKTVRHGWRPFPSSPWPLARWVPCGRAGVGRRVQASRGVGSSVLVAAGVRSSPPDTAAAASPSIRSARRSTMPSRSAAFWLPATPSGDPPTGVANSFSRRCCRRIAVLSSPSWVRIAARASSREVCASAR